MLTLTNNYHNTEAHTRGGRLSVSRVRAIRRQLCGVQGCTCTESDLGTRGPQEVDVICDPIARGGRLIGYRVETVNG